MTVMSRAANRTASASKPSDKARLKTLTRAGRLGGGRGARRTGNRASTFDKRQLRRNELL